MIDWHEIYEVGEELLYICDLVSLVDDQFILIQIQFFQFLEFNFKGANLGLLGFVWWYDFFEVAYQYSIF